MHLCELKFVYHVQLGNSRQQTVLHYHLPFKIENVEILQAVCVYVYVCVCVSV